jgi:ring-1,2-phenylacetyl-CoA epoxidase subunit PaaC
MLLSRAGVADGSGRTDDDLAFGRDAAVYLNVRLAELADSDFADLVVRLLLFASWRYALLDRLIESSDPVLAAIAGKGVKEVAYHRDHAAQWAVRLGDGTADSHQRMRAALRRMWPYVEELFDRDPIANALPGVAVDPAAVRGDVLGVVRDVLEAATLDAPDVPRDEGGGRQGRHTAAVDEVLAELQELPRRYPDARW